MIINKKTSINYYMKLPAIYYKQKYSRSKYKNKRKNNRKTNHS